MIYPEEFEELLESFKKLPGIGNKTAERYVYAINDLDLEIVKNFSNSLLNLRSFN